MADRFASREDVADKIEWEGGLASVLDYGITADDMPDAELEAAWREMAQAYEAYERAAGIVDDMLPHGGSDG